MNIISKIEGATLLTIGAFCAAAITSILLHSANVMPVQQTASAMPVIELPTVVVVGKRLSSIETSGAAVQHVAG